MPGEAVFFYFLNNQAVTLPSIHPSITFCDRRWLFTHYFYKCYHKDCVKQWVNTPFYSKKCQILHATSNLPPRRQCKLCNCMVRGVWCEFRQRISSRSFPRESAYDIRTLSHTLPYHLSAVCRCLFQNSTGSSYIMSSEGCGHVKFLSCLYWFLL